MGAGHAHGRAGGSRQDRPAGGQGGGHSAVDAAHRVRMFATSGCRSTSRLEEYFIKLRAWTSGHRQSNKTSRSGIGTEIGLRSSESRERARMRTQTVDCPAAYITLLEKGTEKALGTYLVSVLCWRIPRRSRPPNGSRWRGKSTTCACVSSGITSRIRFTWTMFGKDDYAGTNTPKNYSSDVRLVDGDGRSGPQGRRSG